MIFILCVCIGASPTLAAESIGQRKMHDIEVETYSLEPQTGWCAGQAWKVSIGGRSHGVSRSHDTVERS